MMIVEVLSMWKWIFSTYFVLLFFDPNAQAQETIRSSALSADISGISTTPRVISNDPARYWVSVWRQQNSIVSRIILKDGTLGSIRPLVTGITTSTRSFDLIYLRQIRELFACIRGNRWTSRAVLQQTFWKTGPFNRHSKRGKGYTSTISCR